MSDTDAFVHISVDAGQTAPVASEVDAVEMVATTHVVTGEFDIIAQLALGDLGVETHDWLQTEIDDDGRDGSVTEAVEQIRNIGGVADTTTSLAFSV